ncbi:MAG: response regulator [Lachnospiraceae bacterium]|nr:response regulator [Lachnospiraceae bacterium]
MHSNQKGCNNMYKSLIIDDENPVRIAIRALGHWHALGIEEPHQASNGKEGLSCCRELHPDIVFVDMQMPIMSGREFLEKAKEEFPNTKFIVVSGYDYFEYAQAAIKNGAMDYLLKPVVEEELNKALERAVNLLNIEHHVESDHTDSETENDISPGNVIEIIKEYIDQNYCQDIRISMFSDKYFFSKEYLSKLYKKKYGYGIYEYALKLRMERAKELLRQPELQILEISDRLGYSNNNYFSKAFKNYYNLSPTEYREHL